MLIRCIGVQHGCGGGGLQFMRFLECIPNALGDTVRGVVTRNINVPVGICRLQAEEYTLP